MKEYSNNRNKKIFKDKPYLKNYKNAKRRCLDRNFSGYKYYGSRGIRFLMTKEDFKFLWFRDKAFLMKQPSIDRKNSNGDYILTNCQFIELKYNTRASGKKIIYLPYIEQNK